MRCQKCQFWCDDKDAFCRKCGAPIATEAVFQEQPETFIGDDTNKEDRVVEASPVTIEMQNQPKVANHSLTVTNMASTKLVANHPKTGITSKVLDLANRALGSEEGKAIVKGAAVLAVGVGMELLNRSRKSSDLSKPNPMTPSERFEPLSDVANLMEPISSLTPGTTIVETWVYRYTYTKRVVRRVR